jgi:hypothetical protein
MKRLVRLALRAGWRRGVLRGSRFWMIVGGLALGVRALHNFAGSGDKVVYSEVLRPGEALVISHERPGVETA